MKPRYKSQQEINNLYKIKNQFYLNIKIGLFAVILTMIVMTYTLMNNKPFITFANKNPMLLIIYLIIGIFFVNIKSSKLVSNNYNECVKYKASIYIITYTILISMFLSMLLNKALIMEKNGIELIIFAAILTTITVFVVYISSKFINVKRFGNVTLFLTVGSFVIITSFIVSIFYPTTLLCQLVSSMILIWTVISLQHSFKHVFYTYKGMVAPALMSILADIVNIFLSIFNIGRY